MLNLFSAVFMFCNSAFEYVNLDLLRCIYALLISLLLVVVIPSSPQLHSHEIPKLHTPDNPTTHP